MQAVAVMIFGPHPDCEAPQYCASFGEASCSRDKPTLSHAYLLQKPIAKGVRVAILLCTSLLFEGRRCRDSPIFFAAKCTVNTILLWPADHRKSHRHPEEFRSSPGCGGKKCYQGLAACNDASGRTSLTVFCLV